MSGFFEQGQRGDLTGVIAIGAAALAFFADILTTCGSPRGRGFLTYAFIALAGELGIT
jgi:hypothetical protein